MTLNLVESGAQSIADLARSRQPEMNSNSQLHVRRARSPLRRRPVRLQDYFVMALVVAVCSVLGWISHAWKLTDANIVMIFLAGVALIAARCGRGPAIAAAVVSVLVFDFFFVVPSFSFAVGD